MSISEQSTSVIQLCSLHVLLEQHGLSKLMKNDGHKSKITLRFTPKSKHPATDACVTLTQPNKTYLNPIAKRDKLYILSSCGHGWTLQKVC